MMQTAAQRIGADLNVRGHGDAGRFAGGPERVVVGISMRTAVARKRRHENPLGLALDPLDFGHRQIHITQVDVGNRDQTVRIDRAVVQQPVVVRAAIGRREFGVRAIPLPGDSDGRIEDRHVNALGVHFLESHVRVDRTRRAAAAFFVGHLSRGHHLAGILIRAAGRPQRSAAQERAFAAVNLEVLVPLAIDANAD